MNPTPDTYVDLFFGYTAIWVLVLIFLFRLMQEQNRLRQELKEIQGGRNVSSSKTMDKNAVNSSLR